MKRFLCLLFCLLMTAALIAGCSSDEKKEEDKGAIIPVYLSSPIGNFDPAYALHDNAGSKYIGLLYEGLFRLGKDGKLEKAIAKSWRIREVPEDNYYMMEIELNLTHWSDGRFVSADDFVFAWKRLLEPEFQSEAASLLFDIKNARAVKDGDMTIDDLGLYAADTSVLQIEFERKIDYDQFLENTASLALVPLREDAVVKLVDWGSNSATMTTNGPFILKKIVYGADTFTLERIELERNVYYYRDVKRDALKKRVFPYRFVIDFTMNVDEQAAAFDAGDIYLNANIPLSRREAMSVELSDTMSTATVVFNNAKAPFDKPEVRRALSMAIDRNALVNTVKYAKAAEGFVPAGTFETTQGTSFRDAGAVINAAGDISGAKSLLSGAGVNGGSFEITIRANDEVYAAVASACVDAWSQLGFTVTVKELEMEYHIENEYDQYRDNFEVAYRAADFDVILVDYYASTNAFGTFASFSRPFSGGAMDLATGSEYANVPHICGYVSDSYDALIESAYAETDRAARAAILHQAEAALANDMPVAPLFNYQLAYAISGELSKVSVKSDGYLTLTKAHLKDYLKLQTAETAATLAEGEEVSKAHDF